jgi:glyoxylase-like metal-dependent hydrolase (beta-lactamase superfamily II)
MFLPRETRLVQHEQTARFVATHLEQDKAFMLQHFGKGRGIEPIRAREPDIVVPVGGRLVLDLGGRQVEIYDFGFAQTGGDLFVWEPQSKTLWAGNPVIAAKPALPWLLDGKLAATLATLQKVYDFLPADATIVPGHGVPMPREGLRWHLDYLKAVQSGVKEALARGLSLEQTVAELKMPEFSSTPSWSAASWPTASCACAATTAATTSWSPSAANAEASARRAGPGAWHRQRRTWWTASFRACRCASRCGFAKFGCRFRCACCWPRSPSW